MSKATESTELKLTTTPTGGLDASHSPYYRRLLSAGYKGYLQGTIGGASLYGAIGLGIGVLAAAPFIGVLGLAGFASLAVAAGGVGVLKGASTFGEIGSTAAINAESADLSEQRRYLLDRYHDLPEGPEGDREAAEIRKELICRQDNNAVPPPLFHWKTVAICAAIGIAVSLALFCTPMGAALFEAAPMAHALGLTAIGMHGALAATIGTAMGAMVGAVVGLDRYYVRKWFDVTEGFVHASPRTDLDPAMRERSDLVSRLNAAAKEDDIVKQTMLEHQLRQTAPITMPSQPAASSATASAPQLNMDVAEKPDTRISEATRHDRLTQLQHAMDVSL